MHAGPRLAILSVGGGGKNKSLKNVTSKRLKNHYISKKKRDMDPSPLPPHRVLALIVYL